MRIAFDWLTRDQARSVDAWLVANGCRHYVSIDHPVIVKGHRAHYARVECSPCHRDECDDLRCLERLDVDGAWERLSDMLRRT